MIIRKLLFAICCVTLTLSSTACSDDSGGGSNVADAGATDTGATDTGTPDTDTSTPQDAGDDTGVTPDADENRAPIADAGDDQTILPGESATLDGAGADSDGDTLSFAWEIVDQPANSSPSLTDAQQATATLTASEPGEYTVELTVDDGSLTDADQVIITVSEGDQPPTAVASAPGSVGVGETVDLDASASSDAVDALGDLDFAWSFTSDPSGGSDSINNRNSYTASFVPSAQGTYELELTVTDTIGNTDTDTVRITVHDGPCVIISEYIEGAGNDKALEIYNCGTSVVDLSSVGYCGEANDDDLAVDGCSGDTVFTGTLAPMDVYVICHTDFGSSAFCDQMYNQLTFNGDDRVVIYYDDDNDDAYTHGTDTILDVLGRLGQRPSDRTIWEDKGLRRCNFTPFDGMSAFDIIDYYGEVPANTLDKLGARPSESCAP